MKYSKVQFGQMEALLNKIGGEEGMLGILGGEFIVVSKEKAAEHKEVPKQKKKTGDAVLDLGIWRKAYEVLGFDDAALPVELENPEPGFWDLPVLQGVTCNKVIAAFKKLGVTLSLYADDLDATIVKNDRTPVNGSYRVRVKATVEADPELASKSANDLAKDEVKGITLLERLLLELAYFIATEKHLDVDNWTLCSGSRYSGGKVPRVYWYSGDRELCVSWRNADYRDPYLRPRAVQVP